MKNRSYQWLRALTAMAVTGVMLCGCGSSTGTASEPAAPAESEAVPAESEAAPAESETTPVESEAAPVESEAAESSATTEAASDIQYEIRVGGGKAPQTYLAVADKLGYFAEEGVKVENISFAGSDEAMQGLISEKIDISTSAGASGPLIFITEGNDFTMWGGNDAGGFPIVAFPDTFKDGYKGLESLKGKKVAIGRNHNPAMVLLCALHTAGIDTEKDLTLIEADKPNDAFQMALSGKADVAVINWMDYIGALDGGMEVIEWTNNLWKEPHHICCRWVSNSKWLEENHDAAIAFTRAMIRAEAYAQQNPEFEFTIWRDVCNYVEEQAKAYTYDLPILKAIDPFSDAIIEMYDEMNKIEYFHQPEDGPIDIKDHININIYKEALDSLCEDYPDEEYFQNLESLYEERNSIMLNN